MKPLQENSAFSINTHEIEISQNPISLAVEL